jgi:hypothetical protein
MAPVAKVGDVPFQTRLHWVNNPESRTDQPFSENPSVVVLNKVPDRPQAKPFKVYLRIGAH